MNKFSEGDLLAILLVAVLVCGLLFMAPAPLFCGVAGIVCNVASNANHQQEWQRVISGTHITDWLTFIVLLFQLRVFGRQAAISSRQAEIADQQRILMEGQLKATQNAADAALASLDRPWLSIEGLKNTRGNWMSGHGELTAEFHVSNHGKASAILVSVKAVLFLGYENIATAPFGGEKIPKTILKFPANEPELKFFLMRLAKWPLVDVSNNPDLIDAIIPRPASGPRTWVSPLWGPKPFDSPVALPNGAATETFRWRESDLVSERNGEIPEDAWAEVFLVGQIVYFGPTIGAEIINFSYKANYFGGFQLHGKAPYNKREKRPDLPSVGF